MSIGRTVSWVSNRYKGTTENTIKEYRTDLLMFLNFVMESLNTPVLHGNFSNC
ncbi:MAG: hypothetical protein HGJ98_01150 [Desulfosporosinus sp.]|nr:hypothetical protein [Desulfosporosinus sp.]